MIERETTINVYLKRPRPTSQERQACEALRHAFPRVVIIPSDALHHAVCPVEGYVWAADGPAGVPPVARALPYYGKLILSEA